METIYSDNEIDYSVIQDSLEQLFPELEIFQWDFVTEEPEEFDNKNKQHIVFNTSCDQDKIEFKFLIDIYRTPEENNQERLIEIARHIARKTKNRILIPYSLPAEPHDPYYDLIFSEGQVFLADDSDTNFADGTEGLVKVLKRIEIENFEFDKKGNLIK